MIEPILSSSMAPVPTARRTAHTAALDWLMGRIDFERTAFAPYQERQMKLDRMRQLLTRLGQPDAGMKIVHVAGTKGKGSVAAMVGGILTAAGYRTGRFSSPHLERIEERFAIDGQPCTAEELVALVDRLRPVVRVMDEEAAADGDPAGGPTYFEVTTAMAVLHFLERQADASLLEVGLGGRLDSTNVCLPAVSVVTSISFDHMKQLGNTLSAIAREKAGIIKPGVPVVSGVAQPQPQAVITEVAREHGCRLIQLGADFTFHYRPASGPSDAGTIDFAYRVAGQQYRLDDVPLAMRGAHQAANAAVALATIAELRRQGWCVSSDAMRLGLSRTALPGRVELVAGTPAVVLDTAHNPASARALVQALAEMPAATRRTLILSVSRDKDVRGIVGLLAPHFDRFVVTEYQKNPRVVAAETLSELLREQLGGRDAEITVCRTPPQAWRHVVRTATPGELACVAGSFYLAAELRPVVRGAGDAPGEPRPAGS